MERFNAARNRVHMDADKRRLCSGLMVRRGPADQSREAIEVGVEGCEGECLALAMGGDEGVGIAQARIGDVEVEGAEE